MLTREDGEIIPQHWRGGTWQKTGDGNPLQIEQHIKTEDNTFVPVSEDNPQPVQVIGSATVETETLITNTSDEPIPVTPVETIDTKITNTSGEPVPITTLDTFDVNVTNTADVKITNESGEPVPITTADTFDVNVTNATIDTKITNTSGEAIPITTSDTIDTKITNTTGEPVPVKPVSDTSRVTLFTGLEIRDTSPHLSTPTVEPDKYKIVLLISNSLDQPVDVSVYSVVFADVINRNGTKDKITVAPYSTEVITDLVGIIEPISEQMKIQLKATNAPTSGSITVYAYLTNRY